MSDIVVDDMRVTDDATEWRLQLEVRNARWRIERLTRHLSRAQRTLLNREKELARYRVDGQSPKRKGFQKRLERAAEWHIKASRSANPLRNAPRGKA